LAFAHVAPFQIRRNDGGERVTPAKFLEARFPNASVQTTERYLGCKQNLGHPVNDRISLGIVAAG
jgi:hypothetical protein